MPERMDWKNALCATNNFRYKLIRYKENVYAVDWLPHWYSVFAGIFICFFKKKAYILTEQQAAVLQRRGGINSLSIFWSPVLTILFCTVARWISQQVNIEGRVKGPLFILTLLLIVFAVYNIWRAGKELKLKKCLGARNETCTIKILCKKPDQERKVYFLCAVAELIFQGGLYGIALWFCFHPGVILNTKIIILVAESAHWLRINGRYIPKELVILGGAEVTGNIMNRDTTPVIFLYATGDVVKIDLGVQVSVQKIQELNAYLGSCYHIFPGQADGKKTEELSGIFREVYTEYLKEKEPEKESGVLADLIEDAGELRQKCIERMPSYLKKVDEKVWWTEKTRKKMEQWEADRENTL